MDIDLLPTAEPVALIPEIGIPDGRYTGWWMERIVRIGNIEFPVNIASDIDEPIAVRVNVRGNHGFVWLEKS